MTLGNHRFITNCFAYIKQPQTIVTLDISLKRGGHSVEYFWVVLIILQKSIMSTREPVLPP